MDYKSLFYKVIAIDSKIRFAAICDMNGHALFSAQGDGAKNLLSPDESQKAVHLALDSWKSRTNAPDNIGNGKYVLVEHEKLKLITMPLDSDHLLCITTDVEVDHTPIIYSILRLKQDALLYQRISLELKLKKISEHHN
jgi:hypothetical protein